jgi:hypothetical protein
MINFGVREVANSKATAAPGWAYVPDTGLNASVSALQPSSRKRARNQPIASQHETTAKQDAKILRELAALDRENHRDVSIPVPIRHRDNAGRGTSFPLEAATIDLLLTCRYESSKPWKSHSGSSQDSSITKDVRKPPLRLRSPFSPHVLYPHAPTATPPSANYACDSIPSHQHGKALT